MNENKGLFPMADPAGRIECRKVTGGIQDREIEVSAGEIVASIHSAACSGGKGGDIYYLGVCEDSRMTRVAIADVTGHGESVSRISRCVYDAMKTHM